MSLDKFILQLQQNGFSVLKCESNTVAVVLDDLGYKYRIHQHNYIAGRNSTKFGRNPYTKDNIRNFLRINRPNLTWIDDEYVDCKHPIKLVCQKHMDRGVQRICLDALVNKNANCKYCSYENRVKRIPTDAIIERCNNLHLEYVGRFTKNQSTWIHYICPKHKNKGIQSKDWDHLKICAVGCPYCTGRYKNTNDFKTEMSAIHPDVTILGEYCGSEGHIQCRCNICGTIWSPVARSLKYGEGCPGCKMSKGERRVKNLLECNNIAYIAQHTFSDCLSNNGVKLRFDFYLPDYRTVIEFDGEQHFQPVDFCGHGMQQAIESFERGKQRDQIKTDYCSKHHIHIIRIPYYDVDNIQKYLKEYI